MNTVEVEPLGKKASINLLRINDRRVSCFHQGEVSWSRQRRWTPQGEPRGQSIGHGKGINQQRPADSSSADFLSGFHSFPGPWGSIPMAGIWHLALSSYPSILAGESFWNRSLAVSSYRGQYRIISRLISVSVGNANRNERQEFEWTLSRWMQCQKIMIQWPAVLFLQFYYFEF